MRLLTTLSFIFSIVWFISCESTTETESPTPYVSLNVGDVRQYYSETDSLFTTIRIIGETYRTDGRKVFITEYIADSTNLKFYDFIKEGYMYSTQLDTNSRDWNLKDNPFVEQRLAKLYPEEGDKWTSIDGEDIPSYFIANYVGDKSTPAKDFKNVFGYTLDSLFTVYYAEGYGHIGSSGIDMNYEIFLNYLKVNGREYGVYVPDTSLPKQNASKTSSKRKYGFFGERLK